MPLWPGLAGHSKHTHRYEEKLHQECLESQQSQQKKIMKLLPEHISGARGMLKMSQSELALASGVSAHTIINFEARRSTLREETELRLIACLEERGIRFKNGNSPTVTLELKGQGS